ncbi:RNA pseudouridine synthase [Deltaproteobacteria bacterium Smac51]|nr:RNA pseudouridine synthase [Deltaproteobacteria bacterium Smac51]
MLTPVIIYEDNHLLIVQKPPGFLAQPDGSGRPDLSGWAGEYLARNKPGRAYVGLTHRLDRAVGGVVAMAKTSKCAARLSAQFRERTVKKIYLALTAGRPEAESGRLEGQLFRDGTVTRAARPGEKGTRAALNWLVRKSYDDFTLLEIELETGFKHQIRAQLAAAGLPVVGDLKYGGGRGEGPGIGLWAESLTLEHPTRKEIVKFEARPAGLWPWSLILD